ncbi:MAG: hypothetical protein LUH15_14435 [Tannerellaceae bacterium]|nr:hypothetical protein [Tannerellaceae bacterium]
MKFIIEFTEISSQKTLIYRTDEHSFDMEPWTCGIDFEIALNTLSLTVVDGTIIQLNGFCGLNKSMKSDCKVPIYKTGLLKILNPENYIVESGAYKLTKEDWPVKINIHTGWVCLGYPEKKGNAVEFINNCVAVIDEEKNLVALWLKPKKISTTKT